MAAKRYSEANIRREARVKWIRTVIIIAIALIIIFRFLIGFSFVNGVSMKNSLQNGDLVFYNRIHGPLQRGEVVSISLPSGEFYVKRIIAVGGDTVDLRDGVIYVNGTAETGNYFIGETKKEDGVFSYPYTLEQGDIFVLGDNREESVDSRYYGAFNESQVSGVLKLCFRGIIPALIR